MDQGLTIVEVSYKDSFFYIFYGKNINNRLIRLWALGMLYHLYSLLVSDNVLLTISGIIKGKISVICNIIYNAMKL